MMNLLSCKRLNYARRLTLNEDILQEIDEILGVEPPAVIPENAVTVADYANSKGLSRGWASTKLRKGWEDGKLERGKGANGRLYYWPKTV